MGISFQSPSLFCTVWVGSFWELFEKCSSSDGAPATRWSIVDNSTARSAKGRPRTATFAHDDAVDWKIIDENPFSKVRTQRSTVKVNEFVPREVVDKLMKKANPVWKVILGLSRYGGLRTPSETLSLRWEDIDWEMNRMSIPEPKVEHHEGRGIRSCPIFPELRSILDEAFEIFGDKSEYVVAAPQYRAAANTAMGWKNSNLRTEMTRLLRRAGVSGWPRLFHSMRASRQTELQREFPLHVVCSWLGNSPRIAQQSYLLVTEDDFAKAAGVAKVMVEG